MLHVFISALQTTLNLLAENIILPLILVVRNSGRARVGSSSLTQVVSVRQLGQKHSLPRASLTCLTGVSVYLGLSLSSHDISPCEKPKAHGEVLKHCSLGVARTITRQLAFPEIPSGSCQSLRLGVIILNWSSSSRD